MSAHSPNMSQRSSNTSRRSSRSVSEETVKNTLAKLRAEQERTKVEQEKILAELAAVNSSRGSSRGSSRRSSICLTSANDSFKSSFSMQRFLEDPNAASSSNQTDSPFLQVDGNATLETVVDGAASNQTPLNLNKETLFQHPESGLRRDPTQFNTSDETDSLSFMPEKQAMHQPKGDGTLLADETNQNFDFEPGEV